MMKPLCCCLIMHTRARSFVWSFGNTRLPSFRPIVSRQLSVSVAHTPPPFRRACLDKQTPSCRQYPMNQAAQTFLARTPRHRLPHQPVNPLNLAAVIFSDVTVSPRHGSPNRDANLYLNRHIDRRTCTAVQPPFLKD